MPLVRICDFEPKTPLMSGSFLRKFRMAHLSTVPGTLSNGTEEHLKAALFKDATS